MPYIVPSQIINLIDQAIPAAKEKRKFYLTRGYADSCAAIIDLIEQLHSYIEVAANLEVIEKDTAIQARLAREYRNLIHPGREKRLGQKCDRGTALSAVAAVERVITDLS